MTYLTPLTVLIAVTAILACVPSRGRGTEAGSTLWLPAGADTDVGVKCYSGGFCDLPFTSSTLDPDGVTDELSRHFSGAGWEQRCPTPEGPTTPEQRGWQTFVGGGVIGVGGDAAVPGTSRYWHCAWHDTKGDVISYHLQTSRMQDGRQQLVGYATYKPRGDDL